MSVAMDFSEGGLAQDSVHQHLLHSAVQNDPSDTPHHPFAPPQQSGHQRQGDRPSQASPQHLSNSDMPSSLFNYVDSSPQTQRQEPSSSLHAQNVQQQNVFADVSGQPPGSQHGFGGDNALNMEDNGQQAPADPQFDIFEWYPRYLSCQTYFINHAQISPHVQAVAAFINIHLPCQRFPNPIQPSRAPSPTATDPQIRQQQQQQQPSPQSISLLPYIRRLVVTGLDFPGVLHGFFGDDWTSGIGPLHEQERRNYLFAAKSGGWASVKKEYDRGACGGSSDNGASGGGDGAGETVPFLRPLQGVVSQEIEAAEKSWSEWLAMEDWMVGPRAPDGMGGGRDDHGRHTHPHHHHHQHPQHHHQHHQQPNHHDSSFQSQQNARSTRRDDAGSTSGRGPGSGDQSGTGNAVEAHAGGNTGSHAETTTTTADMTT